jgi:hypothetical protein
MAGRWGNDMMSGAGHAHGIVGNRVFPGTLAFDDPAVMDELGSKLINFAAVTGRS